MIAAWELAVEPTPLTVRKASLFSDGAVLPIGKQVW
jgi:hypothetical protein